LIPVPPPDANFPSISNFKDVILTHLIDTVAGFVYSVPNDQSVPAAGRTALLLESCGHRDIAKPGK